jgi:competence protein ComEC
MKGRGALAASVLAGIGWLLGCAAQLQMAALWPAPWGWVLLTKALVLVAVGWRWRGAVAGLVLLVLGAGALGFAATHLRAEARLNDRLTAALEGQDLLLIGTVVSLPQPSPDGVRFVFAVDTASLRGQPVTVPQQVSLGWYRGFDDNSLLGGPAEEVRAGQRWRLPVRLRQPHGFANPHGLDFELWLFEQGIRASGSVRSTAAAPARRLGDGSGQVIQRARQAWRDAIQARVRDPAAAGVLAALAIGDQAAIDRVDWELFRSTGIAHLMSISGLHVTMFAWAAGWLFTQLWRCWPRALLWLPAPVAGRWAGLCAAFGYALLAGWGVPAQRTVWMIAVVVLLRQLGLRWPAPLVLLVAAGVVTLLDPWALLQAGFWLSFAAVLLLTLSESNPPDATPTPSGWRRGLALLQGGLRTQALATVGLAPLSMLFFQQISLVGFAANLVAIPVVTLLITPLALLGLLVPPLWQLAALAVQGLSALLHPLAALPWAQWTAAAAPAWAMLLGLLGALLVVLPLPWRLRLCALQLMLPLLAPPVQRPAVGHFELVAADVGQGSAVLLRTRNHLLVYDSGPVYSAAADAGVRVLLPLLRARGERQIDLLMLSHRDTDHVGGAAALLRALPVRALWSSLDDDHPLRRTPGLPHTPCQAGQRWQWDGVQFEVLHPLPEDLTQPGIKSNALSCVLRASGADGRVLLTGDIEAAQETALVQRAGAALRSELLLVPHHGSQTSSTAAFIDAVQPQLAVAQAAYRSRFGHPAPAVVARYAQRSIAVQRSDRCGALTWQGVSTPAVCERSRVRRYWHHPAEPEPGR